MKYIIANWKAHKTEAEAERWIATFFKEVTVGKNVTLIIAPSYHLLYPIKSLIKGKTNICLATQDISRFETGSFTGEVTASTIVDLVRYAIIGHSERRQYFNEGNEILSKKVQLAQTSNIEPIFCIRNLQDEVPQNIKIIAYEPPYAIGTGSNEPIESVLKFKKEMKTSFERTFFLYGGSVNLQNISNYLKSPEIDGFLVGTASLDPLEFAAMTRLLE